MAEREMNQVHNRPIPWDNAPWRHSVGRHPPPYDLHAGLM
jgi:hypothetical protein